METEAELKKKLAKVNRKIFEKETEYKTKTYIM